MDNYEIARDRAQAYFLRFDQEKIIRRWDLAYDKDYLYVEFFSRSYKVCRKTGKIFRDGKQAGFNEVLSIFDLLCHKGEGQYTTGKFAPVNSLRGAPKAGGVETNFHSAEAQRFDRDPERLKRACAYLGGTPADMGDIGYRFSVFGQLQVILKFYRSDEEFPASVTLLWDENTLNFIFYETVFYIAGFLLQAIEEFSGENL